MVSPVSNVHNPVTLVSTGVNPVTATVLPLFSADNYDTIQEAVDAANTAGGGTVRVQTDEVITSTIIVKSNVSVVVDQGVVISATTDIDMVECRENGTWYGGRIYNSNANFSKACALMYSTAANKFGRTGHDSGFRDVQLIGPAEGKGTGLLLKNDTTAACQWTSHRNIICYNLNDAVLFEMDEDSGETGFINSNSIVGLWVDNVTYVVRSTESGTGSPEAVGNVITDVHIQCGPNQIRNIKGSANYKRNFHTNWVTHDWNVADHSISGSVTFTNSGSVVTVPSGAEKFVVGQSLTVTNTTNNNGVITVASITDDTEFTVDETLTDETDGSTTITPDAAISVEFANNDAIVDNGNVVQGSRFNDDEVKLGDYQTDIFYAAQCPTRLPMQTDDAMADPAVWGQGALCYVKDVDFNAIAMSTGARWQYLGGQGATILKTASYEMTSADAGPGIVFGTGTGTGITYTLPNALVGLEVAFYRGGNGTITLTTKTPANESILDSKGLCDTSANGALNAANDDLLINANYMYVKLKCYINQRWEVETVSGLTASTTALVIS